LSFPAKISEKNKFLITGAAEFIAGITLIQNVFFLPGYFGKS